MSRRSIAALSAAWHVGLDVGDLASANSRRAGEQSSEQKNWGAPSEHPVKFLPKNYRFFAAFFFEPLAAFFAIVFSSGCCDSASDARAGRHYGWAEPSTLIPDVDYG